MAGPFWNLEINEKRTLKSPLYLAGATRVELVLTVLETAVLPLNYAPLSLDSDIIDFFLRFVKRKKMRFPESFGSKDNRSSIKRLCLENLIQRLDL